MESRAEDIIATNRKAYQRELELAGTLADTPPKTLAEQDLRSKNRFREHSKPGCELTQTEHKRSTRFPNHYMYTCTCAWVGWLIPPKEGASDTDK